MTDIQDLTLDITQSLEIKAAVGDAWSALLGRLTSENSTPDNKPMPMVLEEWPGGCWLRDLGNGHDHLWGFVQVIKPPNLIEIQGPMFMSYAVAGHLQLRLTQIPGGTELSLRHRVLGMIDPNHREGVTHGWDFLLQSVKQRAESAA
ncbi:MAG: SRPBCC domain-containing protein [Fuerstiella sp.]